MENVDQGASVIRNLINVWPLVVAFASVLVWAIRLEAQVKFQDKELASYKSIQSESMNLVWTKIDTMNISLVRILEALAKIQGKLETED